MQVPNPRKRRNSDQLSLAPSETSVLKRTKLHGHDILDYFPPEFWDTLSKIHLTPLALIELDRRNTRAAVTSPPPSQRFITQPSLSRRKKQQPKTLSAADFLRRCGRRSLEDIRKFARSGGPDLSDIRGFPGPVDPDNEAIKTPPSICHGQKRSYASAAGAANTSYPTETLSYHTWATENAAPYDMNFLQKLIDAGVYPPDYTYRDGQEPPKPDNWEEICRRTTLRRRSLSPSEFTQEHFVEFRKKDASAVKERQVAIYVVPMVAGKISDSRCLSGGIPFTNLDRLTASFLVPGNPGTYHGARPEQLDRRVRDHLMGHIIPTEDYLPIVPNFFLEVKGPDGTPWVAEQQATYHGALGARAMLSLRSYGHDEPIFDNNAYTITSIYQRGILRLYTTHCVHAPDHEGGAYYFAHQVGAYAMTHSREAFQQGAAAYRNLRDWAEEQRNEAIARANERVAERQGMGGQDKIQAKGFCSFTLHQ